MSLLAAAALAAGWPRPSGRAGRQVKIPGTDGGTARSGTTQGSVRRIRQLFAASDWSQQERVVSVLAGRGQDVQPQPTQRQRGTAGRVGPAARGGSQPATAAHNRQLGRHGSTARLTGQRRRAERRRRSTRRHRTRTRQRAYDSWSQPETGEHTREGSVSVLAGMLPDRDSLGGAAR